VHILVLFPNFIFFVKLVRVLAGSLSLLALLGLNDFIKGAVLRNWKVLEDGTLVLIIMNQRGYQVESSIHYHQSAAGFSVL
jgi:hypothetical protein